MEDSHATDFIMDDKPGNLSPGHRDQSLVFGPGGSRRSEEKSSAQKIARSRRRNSRRLEPPLQKCSGSSGSDSNSEREILNRALEEYRRRFSVSQI
jgi:hypothetical protein